MEHLSRRTTRGVEHLLIVTDPTQRGIVAAERIAGFRHQMDIHIEQTGLILNRLNGDIPAPLQARIDEMDIPLLGAVPADEQLMEFEFSGRPLIELGDASPVYTAVADIMANILPP
jgi:CO dehydrogenase maturation factor